MTTRGFGRLLGLLAILLFAGSAARAQEESAKADRGGARVAITSPVDGAILTEPTVDVAVSWDSRAKGDDDKDHGKITSIDLLAAGVEVGSVAVPKGKNRGTHTFQGVDLSPFSGKTLPLVARANLGKKEGKSVDSVSVRVTIQPTRDTTPPQILDVLPVNGAFTSQARPAVAARITDAGGSGVEPSSIVLRLDGQTVTPVLTPVGPNLLTLAFSPPADLAAGPHTILIDAKDKAGNIAPTSTSTFTIDLTPPSISAVSPSEGALLNTPTPPLSATLLDLGGAGLDPAATFLRLDGAIVPAILTLTTPAQGTITFTPPAPLSQGPHTVRVESADRAGNPAPAAVATFLLDLTLPSATILSPVAGSAGRNPRPILSGRLTDSGGAGVDAGSVALTLNGTPLAATAVLDGPDAATVTFTPSSDLAEGTHTLALTGRDRAGNAAVPATAVFVIDLTPPLLSNPLPADGSTVPNRRPTISASWSDALSGLDASTAQILLDGQDVSGPATKSPTGFSFTPAGDLALGAHVVVASVRDAAGNTGTRTWTFTVEVPAQDTTPPLIFDPTPPNGSSTPSVQPTISAKWTDAGSGIATASARILLDGVDVTGAAGVGPAGFSFVPAPLAAGPHQVFVTVRDVAGNEGSLAWTFNAGTTPPADAVPPTVTILAPAPDGFTRSARPSLLATVSDLGDSGLLLVTARLDGNPTGATVQSDGPSRATVTFLPPADLAEGPHTYEVIAQDNAGNLTTRAVPFVVDLTPPSLSLSVAPSTGSEKARTISFTYSDSLSGVEGVEPVLLVDLVDLTAGGVWDGATFSLVQEFPPGTHGVVAEIRDRAGNLAQATAAFTVDAPAALDGTPPIITLASPTFSITKVRGTSLPVLVEARDDAASSDTGIDVVRLLVNGAEVQSLPGAAAQDGIYYLFTLPLTDPASQLSVSAVAVDKAGNASTSLTTTVDLVAPPSFPPVDVRLTLPATAVAGQPFNVTMTQVDAQGNPVPFNTVVWLTAHVPGTSVFVPFNGQSTRTESITIRKSGIIILTAENINQAGVKGSAAIRILPGPPANIQFLSGRDDQLNPGDTFGELRVVITDAEGNPVPNATVEVTVTFLDGGTPIAQQTFTISSNVLGIAQVPPMIVPSGATGFTASGTTSTPSGPVSGSTSGSVQPSVDFQIVFRHAIVQAGMPVSFTIIAINRETGEIKTDFTGTVHVYRHNPESRRIHGASTYVDGDPTSGEMITVQFTEADQGVKHVADGIVLTARGESVLVASTEAPVTEEEFDTDITAVGEPAPFMTLTLLTLADQKETFSGFSNEIVVLSATPARFVTLSLETFPISATAILVDRFSNPVYLEPVEFTFTVNGSATSVLGVTDIRGLASAVGPTDLDRNRDNTVVVVAKAVNHPPPNGVPLASRTEMLGAQTDRGTFLAQTDPTLIEVGLEDQPVSDLDLTEKGASCTPFVTFSFQAVLLDEFGPGGITFKGASFTSSDVALQGPLEIDGGVIRGTARNINALQPTIQNGVCSAPAQYAFTFRLSNILVDVPDDGAVVARHSDGRLNVAAGESRTIAYFKKAMTFVGSVLPAGTAGLGEAQGKKRAGVFIVDADSLPRALIQNPALIEQNVSATGAGTFRVQVMDKDLTVDPEMRIKLESLGSDGSPLVDPETGDPVPNTEVLVPVRALSEANGTMSNALLSLPVVALDREYAGGEAVSGSPAAFTFKATSAVPADGVSQAKVSFTVTYPDGTPAPGASIQLSLAGPSPTPPPALTTPTATDAAGRSTAFVTSTVAGTVGLTATVNVPAAEGRPGFTASSESPLRITFVTHLYTITAVPGGIVKATLVKASPSPGGGVTTSPVGGFESEVREALAVGVRIDVRPAEEADYRTADFAVFKGLSPSVQFTFVPAVVNFDDVEARVIVDDGSDASALDRPDDLDQRLLDIDEGPFSKDGAVLTWTVPEEGSPFRDGANRIRLVIRGPTIATARMMVYTDETRDQELLSGWFPRDYKPLGNGDLIVERTVILDYDPPLSDPEVDQNIALSNILKKHKLIPAGLVRNFSHVALILPEGANEETVAAVLHAESRVNFATILGKRFLNDETGYYLENGFSGMRSHFQLMTMASGGDFLNDRNQRVKMRRSTSGVRMSESADYMALAADGYGAALIPKAGGSIALRLPTAGYASAVQVVGSRAYVADSGLGLLVYDISGPPQLLGAAFADDHITDLEVLGPFVFAALADTGVEIFDVANPSDIKAVGVLSNGKGLGIDILGNVAAVAVGSDGVLFLNILDPANPGYLATVNTPGAALNVDHFGTVVYVADGASGISVIDCRNPASPVLVRTIAAGAFVHSARISGDTLIVSCGPDGVRRYGLADPLNPALQAQFALPGRTLDAVAFGTSIFTAQSGIGALQVSQAGGAILATYTAQDAQEPPEKLPAITVEIIKLDGTVAVLDPRGGEWLDRNDMDAAGLKSVDGDFTIYDFGPVRAGTYASDGTKVTLENGKVIKIHQTEPGVEFLWWLKNGLGANEGMSLADREKAAQGMQTLLGIAEFVPPADILLAAGRGDTGDLSLEVGSKLFGPVGTVVGKLAKRLKKAGDTAGDLAKAVSKVDPKTGKVTQDASQLKAVDDQFTSTPAAEELSKKVNGTPGKPAKEPVFDEDLAKPTNTSPGLKITNEAREMYGEVAMRSFANTMGYKRAIPDWKPGKNGFDDVYRAPDGRLVITEAKGGSSKLHKYDDLMDYRVDPPVKMSTEVRQMSKDWVEIVAHRLKASKDPTDKAMGELVLKELKAKNLVGLIVRQKIEVLPNGKGKLGDILVRGLRYDE